MNRIMQEQDLGRIEVSQQVIASIAGHSANGCYGIVAMAARGLRDGIAERLQRENLHRGIEVKVDTDGINIDLYCVVEYGVRITEVAHSLQDAVRYQVEKALGIKVKTVNVNVQGIHMQDEDVPHALDREKSEKAEKAEKSQKGEKSEKKAADG
jgi:uncharacterized alkaline shock family protein YloU